jgi:hypothetical protein
MRFASWLCWRAGERREKEYERLMMEGEVEQLENLEARRAKQCKASRHQLIAVTDSRFN